MIETAVLNFISGLIAIVKQTSITLSGLNKGCDARIYNMVVSRLLFLLFFVLVIYITPGFCTHPSLQPGNGWNRETIVPDPVGDEQSANFSARCIARWGTIPYRTFNDSILISVIAFHINGIEKVEFSANGGDWVAISDPIAEYWDGISNNTLEVLEVSGGGEYVAKLNAHDFNVGERIEVRARIYPSTAGQCRVLPDTCAIIDNETEQVCYLLDSELTEVWVDANSGNDNIGLGTKDNPFATIEHAVNYLSQHDAVGGSNILLQPGNYSLVSGDLPPTHNESLLSIKSAPEVTQGEVLFNIFSDRVPWNIIRTKVQGVTVYLDTTSGANEHIVWGCYPDQQNAPQMIWWNQCVIEGAGADNCSKQGYLSNQQYVMKEFFTNVEIKNCNHRIVNDVWYIRDLYMHDCSDDVFNRAKLVYNTKVEDHFQVCSQHSDIWQFYGHYVDNYIYFNIDISDVRAQIWFPGATNDNIIHNVALVNVLGAHNSNGGGTSRQHRKDHVVFWHITWPNQTMLFSNGVENSVNSQIRGCYFNALGIEHSISRTQIETAVDIRDNCLSPGSTLWGENCTAAQPRFINEDEDNFTFFTPSPLENKVSNRIIAVDLSNEKRSMVSSAGCYENGITGIKHDRSLHFIKKLNTQESSSVQNYIFDIRGRKINTPTTYKGIFIRNKRKLHVLQLKL